MVPLCCFAPRAVDGGVERSCLLRLGARRCSNSNCAPSAGLRGALSRRHTHPARVSTELSGCLWKPGVRQSELHLSAAGTALRLSPAAEQQHQLQQRASLCRNVSRRMRVRGWSSALHAHGGGVCARRGSEERSRKVNFYIKLK